jgi:hypothetical protein
MKNRRLQVDSRVTLSGRQIDIMSYHSKDLARAQKLQFQLLGKWPSEEK